MARPRLCRRLSSLDDNESMSSGDTAVTAACLQKLPSGGVASVGPNPPLTPKTQKRGAPNTAPTGRQTPVQKLSNCQPHSTPSYSAGDCECGNVSVAANAYSNYDIPKSNPVVKVAQVLDVGLRTCSKILDFEPRKWHIS